MHVRLDHVVLTVANIETTVAFYERTLGLSRVVFDSGRIALTTGDQKLNLHQLGDEIEPTAARPTPGSGDLCFVADATAGEIAAHLASVNVTVELGPVPRTGARGRIVSFYFRDPDRNLLELSTYSDR